ncbi:NAD(P)-binding domain-containing protein, partial [bacterium]|nr:NAD(P)-binding domain-containing protein [bacterium]
MEAFFEKYLIWGLVLASVVTGVWVYLRNFRAMRSSAARRLTQNQELGMDRPMGQYPLVDSGQCIGCGTCVDACPEGDVLGIVSGRAMVINGARCIGHGKCAEACPVGAIIVGLGDVTKRDDIPQLDANRQTNVPGLYVAGELSGFALIHNAVNQGAETAKAVAQSLKSTGPRDTGKLDLVIVGAGPAGMSAGLTACELGLSFVVLDQQGAGGTILQYPRRKLVMVQPITIPTYGPLKKLEYRKEQLLEIWNELHKTQGLDIRVGVRVTGV